MIAGHPASRSSPALYAELATPISTAGASRARSRRPWSSQPATRGLVAR